MAPLSLTCIPDMVSVFVTLYFARMLVLLCTRQQKFIPRFPRGPKKSGQHRYHVIVIVTLPFPAAHGEKHTD